MLSMKTMELVYIEALKKFVLIARKKIILKLIMQIIRIFMFWQHSLTGFKNIWRQIQKKSQK